MNRNPEAAAEFLRELANLSYRLAEHGFVVDGLHADYSYYRSWQITVSRTDEEAIKVSWDARDCVLEVETSPCRKFISPNEWRVEMSKDFNRNSESAPLQFLEQYLKARFPR